jgi:carbon-monoxide dehydrogenase medium subunit
LRLEYRQAMEIAIVGAAAVVLLDGSGRCSDARLALTAVAPTCVRAPEAEDVLRGKTIDSGAVDQASRAAAASARPIDDVRASAEYRRAMVQVIAARALGIALDRAHAAMAR